MLGYHEPRREHLGGDGPGGVALRRFVRPRLCPSASRFVCVFAVKSTSGGLPQRRRRCEASFRRPESAGTTKGFRSQRWSWAKNIAL